jgi:DNA-binding response OmpR family regulator
MTPDDKAKGELAEVAPARILVIDDEEIIHSSLRKILGRRGHEVVTVLSADEGLEKLGYEHFDLVITDLMMPGRNGLELIEQMRKDGREAPVMMITGYPTIRTAVQALRLGAVDYLAKPFTRQELLGPVCRALRRAEREELAGPPSYELPAEGQPEFDEGIQAPQVNLAPGDRYCLKKHSWALFRQDGSMDVGIEYSFLMSVGRVEALEVPRDGDIVEQGHVSIRLSTAGGEQHSAFMPLSGQVIEVNGDLIASPGDLDDGTWVVRILPSNLDEELPLLKRCSRGS